MQLQEFSEDGAVILTVEGRLDTAAANEFETRLLALIDGGARRLCIDCGGLTYLNSSALRGFLVAAQRMRAVGGKLAISDLSDTTRKIFEVIGFTKIITIVPKRVDALRHLAAEPVTT
jgi:anti-anti-sigma factor